MKRSSQKLFLYLLLDLQSPIDHLRLRCEEVYRVTILTYNQRSVGNIEIQISNQNFKALPTTSHTMKLKLDLIQTLNFV